MKKVFVLALLFVSLSTIQAQTVGFRVGANLSNLNFNQDSLSRLGITKEGILGLALAIPIEFSVHKNISIQTELGFLQKGFKSVQSVRAGGSTVVNELKNYTNYATLPVMFKFHTAGSFVQAYVNIGLDAAFAMSAETSGTTTNGTTATEVSNDVNLEGSRRFSIGIQAGGGVKLILGKAALVLDGRFLSDLKEAQNVYNTIDGLRTQAATPQSWMTSLGIVFAL